MDSVDIQFATLSSLPSSASYIHSIIGLGEIPRLPSVPSPWHHKLLTPIFFYNRNLSEWEFLLLVFLLQYIDFLLQNSMLIFEILFKMTALWPLLRFGCLWMSEKSHQSPLFSEGSLYCCHRERLCHLRSCLLSPVSPLRGSNRSHKDKDHLRYKTSVKSSPAGGRRILWLLGY